MAPILTISNMNCEIDKRPLLRGIDFEVYAGQVLAVIGPNGAGKTTLLKTITQDLPLSKGAIQLNGKSITKWKNIDRARHLAMLPQSSMLNFPYTVKEVVELGRYPHATGVAVDQNIIQQCMQGLDINRIKQRLYTSLSGGEKQRVHLARVLSQVWADDVEGRLLLLDEPLAALDLHHQQQLLALLKQKMQTGLTVVMTVHDINVALRYADNVLVLDKGSMMAMGEPNLVIDRELLKNTFQVDAHIHKEEGSAWISIL